MTCIAFDVKDPEEFVGHCSAVGTVVCLIKMRNLLSNVKERRPARKPLVARAFRYRQRQLADLSSTRKGAAASNLASKTMRSRYMDKEAMMFDQECK